MSATEQSTKYQAQNTKYKASSPKHQVQAQSPKHQVQSTKYKAPSNKAPSNKAPSTKHQVTMTTAIVHHPVFKDHDTGPNHPESPSRYSVVMDALRTDERLWPTLLEVQAKEAPRGDIQACHTPQLYKTIERVVSEGSAYLDADTVVSMHSLDPARYAAGAPCQAIDLVMTGRASNAFVP